MAFEATAQILALFQPPKNPKLSSTFLTDEDIKYVVSFHGVSYYGNLQKPCSFSNRTCYEGNNICDAVKVFEEERNNAIKNSLYGRDSIRLNLFVTGCTGEKFYNVKEIILDETKL